MRIDLSGLSYTDIRFIQITIWDADESNMASISHDGMMQWDKDYRDLVRPILPDVDSRIRPDETVYGAPVDPPVVITVHSKRCADRILSLIENMHGNNLDICQIKAVPGQYSGDWDVTYMPYMQGEVDQAYGLKQRRLCAKDKAVVRQLATDGLSQRKIADMMRLSRTSVRDILDPQQKASRNARNFKKKRSRKKRSKSCT